MQADPIRPMLKAPGTEHLKLKFDVLLSNCGLKFDLRQYIMGDFTSQPFGPTHYDFAGYSQGFDQLADLIKAGRCRLRPVFASTEQDVLRLGSMTQCPRVILCDLTMCYPDEGALSQRL